MGAFSCQLILFLLSASEHYLQQKFPNFIFSVDFRNDFIIMEDRESLYSPILENYCYSEERICILLALIWAEPILQQVW